MNKEGRMIIRRWEEIDKCRDETVSARTDTPKNGKEERSGLCWNFPRVKLRRLFNAKSLDDILGRNRSKTGSQTSIIQKQNAQSHSNLSSLNKGRLTTKSETNFPAIVAENPQLLKASARNSSAATEVVITHSNSSSSRVKGAKSDNCLHRIVTSTCTKLGSNSVDNLDKNDDDNDETAVEEIVEEEQQVVADTKKTTEDKVIISEKSGRKRSQVSPLDEQEESNKMTKEKAKLVVANVTYLQRPLSPTPALFFQQQSPANDNNVFRVPTSSPSSISSGPPLLWTTSSSSSNRNQFYSPPGTNNTQCAKSSYSYNYNNQIKLERPIPRNNNQRLGLDNNNQQCTTQHRGYSPVRANNEISAGPASWSHSDPSNKLRFRPQSPPGRISRHTDVCDNNRSTLTGQRKISARARPKSVDASLRLGLSSKDFPEGSPGEKMGDLESPQYVKRTAHMFDSRYTSQINGSESRVDQSSRLSTGNGPSYLNVSRSVCGYSCLSYNNTNGTTSTAGSNGLMTTGIYKRSVESSGSYRPGTLQAANGTHLQSSSSTSSKRDPFKSTSSPGMDVENSQNCVEQQQVAGITSRKSNILEKIERLYGTNAVTTTSLWRRPVPVSDKAKANGSSRSSEKIIPILLQTSELSRDGTYKAKLPPLDPLIRAVDNKPLVSQGNDKPLISRAVDDKHEEDDLYSKHHVLHSNNNYSNGHDQAKDEENLEDDNNSSPSSRPPQKNITSRIIREAASPSAKLNQIIMGKEFQSSHPDEVLQIEPHKNQDFVDGDAKPVFRIVASLTPSSVEEKSASGNRFSAAESEAKFSLESAAPESKSSSVLVQEPQELTQVTTVSSAAQDLSNAQHVSSSNKAALTANNVASNKSDGSVEKNGEYFLQILNTEKEKISGRIKIAEERMESLDSSPDSPDVELYGQIFAVVGKARLLINKKFKQFQGLCNDNIEQRAKGVSESEPFTTKNEDLEGFWDMVLIQVGQIHSMFDNLDGKTETVPLATPKKLETPRKRLPAATPKTGSKSKTSGTTARDESRRKMLAERRAAMKSQLEAEASPEDQSVSSSVQIFLHDSNNTSET